MSSFRAIHEMPQDLLPILPDLPSGDDRLARVSRRRYSLHHGMLPEGRRQRKAHSPASLRQGASQTFFQQIYAFTRLRGMLILSNARRTVSLDNEVGKSSNQTY